METLSTVALLDIFPDPVIIVDPDGRVIEGNRAADVRFGAVTADVMLGALSDTPEPELLTFVRRCTASTALLPGRISIAGRATKIYGARIGEPNPKRLVALRLAPEAPSEFALLTRKIDELNAEVANRRRTQALLEESLSEKLVLLRELHHRVKNNIQFVLGLFSARRRQPGPPELMDFLDVASQRLLAIGTVQQLMYQAESIGCVDAAEFVRRLCDAIAATLDPRITVTANADSAEIGADNAFALALILNELVTNAAKHGVPEGGTIRIGLHVDGPEAVLTVEDDGPGLPPDRPASRASGLGLVRGLARQAGARMEVRPGPGARWRIAVPVRARTEERA